MTIQIARLEKLLPGLSIEERLDAVLDRYRADLAPELSLAATVPLHEARRWNGIVDLLHATHVQLGWYVGYLEAGVTQLELRHGMQLALQYARLALEGHMLSMLLDLDGGAARAKVRKQELWIDFLNDELVRCIAGEIMGRWVDLRMAELVTDSLKEECLGRDIVHPDTRATLKDCREGVLAVKKTMEPWLEFELPEPLDRDVERLLQLLKQEAMR